MFKKMKNQKYPQPERRPKEALAMYWNKFAKATQRKKPFKEKQKMQKKLHF